MVLLDIDMPRCCAECLLYDDRWDYPTCYVNDKSMGYTFDIHKKRMPHCPLSAVKYWEDLFVYTKMPDPVKDYSNIENNTTQRPESLGFETRPKPLIPKRGFRKYSLKEKLNEKENS